MEKILNKHKPNTPRRKKVFVMMSGGVDSSVAAYLLKRRGKYDVIGMFIKGYNIDGCQEKDATDARRAAEFLKVPFYTVDLEKDYKKLVVDYMVDGYKKGITPNPDVMCNKEIKFGLFLKKALELGADCVATGHYVRLRAVKGKKANGTKRDKILFSLYQAKDKNKDQSYFLWTLTQEQLKHCLFPIGDYLKSEVRAIAKKAGLPTASKKDSQGICFLGQISVKEFLKQFLPVKKGNILDTFGKKTGEHEGVWFYTIGQRHGLNLGMHGKGEKNNLPYYVSDKDLKTNTIIVAQGDTNIELYKKEVDLADVNFIPDFIDSDRKGRTIFARVRYRQPLFKAELINSDSKNYKIVFNNPQKFVTPGQSAVIYGKDGQMIGGGVIKR